MSFAWSQGDRQMLNTAESVFLRCAPGEQSQQSRDRTVRSISLFKTRVSYFIRVTWGSSNPNEGVRLCHLDETMRSSSSAIVARSMNYSKLDFDLKVKQIGCWKLSRGRALQDWGE